MSGLPAIERPNGRLYRPHAEYLASLSPLGRAVYEVRDFIRRRTWRLRMRLGDRWRQMTGRAADADEPPF